MKTRAHIKISGKVQGVFFRKNAKEKADELCLKGWVRNTLDEKVEILAEGEENNLKKFIEWCYNGSESSVVSKVSVKFCGFRDEFNDFEIRF